MSRRQLVFWDGFLNLQVLYIFWQKVLFEAPCSDSTELVEVKLQGISAVRQCFAATVRNFVCFLMRSLCSSIGDNSVPETYFIPK
jgi:hypothetical protein